jgi:hypothetical protein
MLLYINKLVAQMKNNTVLQVTESKSNPDIVKSIYTISAKKGGNWK